MRRAFGAWVGGGAGGGGLLLMPQVRGHEWGTQMFGPPGHLMDSFVRVSLEGASLVFRRGL
jgi:hypothetical protein